MTLLVLLSKEQTAENHHVSPLVGISLADKGAMPLRSLKLPILGFLTLIVLASNALAQVRDLSGLRFIDPKTVLMSPEYTFQDQEMVDEPGRMSIRTPHKIEKTRQFALSLLADRGLNFDTYAIANMDAFKAGYFMEVTPGERWYVNSEPVCIEVNHTPRNIYGVAEISPEIFATAAKIHLVPYVQPAAERSGMGHIHIGGATIGQSPFFSNPLLLRNYMVYVHKHPALLWGFAEAYDVGPGSNIETLHTGNRQALFERAVHEFDQWWHGASAEQKKDGLFHYLSALKRHGGWDFFQHYRATNLEHLNALAGDGLGPINPELAGKLTVELRNFRPPQSPDILNAELEMLLRVFDHLSDPNHIEEFKNISEREYVNFFSASKVASDWEEVKREVGIRDTRLDSMIGEHIDAVHRYEYPIQGIDGARLFNAYSRKDDKGSNFELLIPGRSIRRGTISLGDRIIPLEKIQIGGKVYWTATLETKGPNAVAKSEDLKQGRVPISTRLSCPAVLVRAAG